MKAKLTLLILISLFISGITYSQDIIVVDNGDEIKAKVIEVVNGKIKYTKWENQNGNIITVETKYIFMIKYADGRKEVFNSSNKSTKSGASDEVIKVDSTKYKKTYYTGPIKINEPEFDGNVIYVNDTIGDGITLEKLESQQRDENEFKKMFDYSGKVTGVNYVKNCCSSVRIKQNSNLVFLLPYQERVNPFDYIKVLKLKKEKKARSVVEYDIQVHIVGDAAEKDMDKENIPYTYKRYGERSYLIFIEKLEPGEYAITVNSNRRGDFHLFGID